MRRSPWRWLHNLWGLFFPNLCLSCGDNLPASQEIICLSCQYEMPKTGYHLQSDNAFGERFWGRVPIEAGAALFYYAKGGRVQHLIHQLKYHGQSAVGLKLGEWYGQQLKKSPLFATIDGIVPVPLHPRKQHERGYNQSEVFARGLSLSLHRPVWPKALMRPEYTSTQTQKSRLARLENVMEAFALGEVSHLAGQHLLLVDDVMTTGATLEACANLLHAIPEVKVSMLTLAIAAD